MAQYDSFAKRYYQERQQKKEFNWNNCIESPEMIRMVGDVKNKRIIDLGCGFGDHAEKFSEQGAREILGLDISKKLIELANEKGLTHAKFIVHDLNKRFPAKSNHYDIAVSSLTIHYLKEIDHFFKETHRVLKKGGFFVFSTQNPLTDSLIMKKYDLGYERIFGYKKNSKTGKREVFGDYYYEGPRTEDWGGGVKIKMYKRTYETLIKAIVRNGFNIIDYVDAKPIPSSRRLDPGLYDFTQKVPSFCFFKLNKK